MIFNKLRGNFHLFAILTMLVFYRIYVLICFGFKQVDQDQAIMWLGTKNYSNGKFHEPFFYGQNYNVMLESFLAAPIFKLGVPLHYAMPLVSSFLCLLPFLLFSRLALKEGKSQLAIIVLSIPLLLPIEYDLLTSISRGFVSGLAFFSLSFLFQNVFNGTSLKRLEIIVFFAVVAFTINPNSILLSLPYLGYLLLKNKCNKEFFLRSIIGFSFGVLIYSLAHYFYKVNPEYSLHGYELIFSLKNLINGLEHLDSFFNIITPIFWQKGIFTVIIPLLFSFYFYKNEKIEMCIISILAPFLFILPLTASKVHDGTNSIFFHFGRMFLAIPCVLAFMLTKANFNFSKLGASILLLPFIFMIYKTYNLQGTVEENRLRNHVVSVGYTNELINNCAKLSNFSKKNKIDLIIFSDLQFSEIYAYGCSACQNEFPETLFPKYERRTWRLKEDVSKIYKKILIFEGNRELSSEYENIVKLDLYDGLYLINNNQIPAIELIKKLKIPLRKF